MTALALNEAHQIKTNARMIRRRRCTEFRNIFKAEIAEERGIGLRLMFDPGHELDERVLREQFRY